MNIRGLMPRTVPTKVPFIRDTLHHTNQMFVILTETWLRDQNDAEIAINGYTSFREDRVRPRRRRGRDSGGVAIYLRHDLASSAEYILNFSIGVIEVLGIHCKAQNLVLIAVYRQPDDTVGNHRSTSREFRQALDAIRESLSALPTPIPEIVLAGDFNLPHMKWPEGSMLHGASRDEQTMITELQELMEDHFLFQHIHKATQKDGNTLDLCFTNNPAFLHSYECQRTTMSDHYIIEAYTSFNCEAKKRESFRQPEKSDTPAATFDKLNFLSEEVDWEGLEQELGSYDWESEFNMKSPADMVLRFYELCATSSKKFCPERKNSASKKRNRIPRYRRNLMRRRSKVNKQLASQPSDTKRQKLRLEAREIEKKLQKSYKDEKLEMENKAVSAIKKNSKYFFSYVRKFSKIFTGIGPFIDASKNIITCSAQMAEMLSEQYRSVFSVPKERLKPPEEIFTDGENPPGRTALLDVQFNEEDIVKAIGEMSPTAAAGPDRLPAILLKQCRTILSRPLFIIWRKSLDLGEIPSILKTASIIPIHKGGSRGIPKNYRPIALTSHLIKVFEKVVRRSIIEYMEKHNLFNPSQHGFRQGRSCLSQLVAHYDSILELLEKGGNVDVIYIDFAKAFDKVDFGITLEKLNALGIRGKVGRWMHSFLTHRTQSVLANEGRSEPSDVKSGVPQGSVLGPLLFLILLGDIDQGIAKAFVSSFADDTRIGSLITSAEDGAALQTDLDHIYSWTDTNNMKLNGDKFECLRYGGNHELHSSLKYKSNTGIDITEKPNVRDLGVLMSNSGTFKEHIQHTVTEAKKQCSWILRTFQTRDPILMVTLWKSLIQCKLEYCSQLWCPIRKGEIQTIEMVQRSFLRRISGYNELDYWEQLRRLKLYSLERRRERYRIIYVWRILEGQVPNIKSANGNSEKISSKWHPRRGRECIIPAVSRQAPTHIQNLIYASLPIHGQRLFNTLPADIRNITGCSVDSFKRRLDKYLQSVPDEPQIPGYTAQRRAESNSLLDMSCLANARHEPVVEEPGDSTNVTLVIDGVSEAIALAQ